MTVIGKGTAHQIGATRAARAQLLPRAGGCADESHGGSSDTDQSAATAVKRSTPGRFLVFGATGSVRAQVTARSTALNSVG